MPGTACFVSIADNRPIEIAYSSFRSSAAIFKLANCTSRKLSLSSRRRALRRSPGETYGSGVSLGVAKTQPPSEASSGGPYVYHTRVAAKQQYVFFPKSGISTGVKCDVFSNRNTRTGSVPKSSRVTHHFRNGAVRGRARWEEPSLNSVRGQRLIS